MVVREGGPGWKRYRDPNKPTPYGTPPPSPQGPWSQYTDPVTKKPFTGAGFAAQPKADPNQQYMTDKELQTYQANQNVHKQVEAAGKQKLAELQRLGELAKLGPGGVKMLQAKLNQEGFKVAVDGVAGPSTQKAYNDYYQREAKTINDKYANSAYNASFSTIRSQSNQELQATSKNARDFVLSQANNYRNEINKQIDELYRKNGLNHATQYGTKLHSKADQEILDHLSEQSKNWTQVIQATMDPINGADNVTVDGIRKRILDMQKAELQAANEADKKKGKGDSFSWTSPGDYWNKLYNAGKAVEIQSVKSLLGPAGDQVFNRGSAAYAAAFETQLHGGGVFQMLQSAGISATIIPFTHISILSDLTGAKHGEAYKQAFNTYAAAQRDALYEKGDLLSMGQVTTGTVTAAFAARHPGWHTTLSVRGLNQPNRIVYPGDQDWLSGTADVITIVVKDPTIIASEGLSSFAHIGESAANRAVARLSAKQVIELGGEEAVRRGARGTTLAMTSTGRRLVADIGEVIATRANSVLELTKALPGLPSEIAEKAFAARAAEEGVTEAANNAAKKVIVEAFLDGKYNPHVGILRQGLNLVADTASKIPGVELGGVGLGRKAVQLSDRLTWLRQLAAPYSVTSAIFESRAANFVRDAVEVSASAVSKTSRSIWHDLVEPRIAGMSVVERYYQAAQYIERTGNIALQHAREGITRPYFTNEDLIATAGNLYHFNGAGAVDAYMAAVVQQQGFEQALRELESIIAIHSGEAGADALKHLNAMLPYYLLPESAAANVVRNAALNTGVTLGPEVAKATGRSVKELIEKLPAGTVRDHFNNLFEAVAGKGSSWSSLQRDVKNVLENQGLQKEVKRIIEENLARADLKAPDVVGNVAARALKYPARKLARGALSLAEVVGPRELRLAYDTENASMHSVIRAKAMDRLAAAYNLDPVTRNAFIRRAEAASTEEEVMRVADAAARAGLIAKGVKNVDAVMAILRDTGRFTSNSVSRYKTTGRGGNLSSIDQITGELIRDPQVLAQRIESYSVPSEIELAQSVRKAILDGIEDANLARKTAERLRVVAVAPGKVKILFGKYSIIDTVHNTHRLWKFLMVTNGTMPLVGAAAGFVGGPGDSFNDRLRNAGLGLVGGLTLGGVRTIGRISGLEGRIRIILAEGFTPEMAIPGYSRIKSRFGAFRNDINARTLSEPLVLQGVNAADAFFNNAVYVHTDPTWVAIEANASNQRAVDGLDRILNYQITPEWDPVVAIGLREQAGHLDAELAMSKVAPEAREPAVRRILREDKSERAADIEELRQLTNDSNNGHFFANRVQREIDENGAGHNGLDERTVNEHRNGAISADERIAQIEDKWIAKGNPIYQEDLRPGLGALAPDERLGQHGPPGPKSPRGVAELRAANVPKEGTVGAMVRDGIITAEEARDPNIVASVIANKLKKEETNAGVLAAQHAKDVREYADNLIAQFLGTEEGRVWAERWAGIGVSPKEAVERMRSILDSYSNQEIASIRVGGGPGNTTAKIDRATLKRHLQSEGGPKWVHIQPSWKFPRTVGEVFGAYKKLVGKTVLTGPDNMINRRPWHRALFGREYDRLIRNGVEAKEAQRLADAFATERSNAIMHRFDEPTQFAAKVDLFLPFQHAREDMLRVYSKLALERPFQTYRLVYHAAQAFNVGAKTGIFTKNEFTGQWQMTIPGSGRLSKALFQMPFEVPFDANIKDTLFVAQGAFGIGFIPSLGGPFWTVFSKELVEHQPDLFKGDDALHKFMFPYGPGGNLLSGAPSRLWMALTGDTPPWDFETQDQWKNTLNHYKEEVGRELMYRNRLRGGSPDYIPSDEEVTGATRKLMAAWSFFSSTFPAPSFPSLTSQEKYNAAKNDFTLGGILEWNAGEFLKKYPEFEAYLSGPETKYTGPDDLDHLRKLKVGAPFNSYSKFNPDSGQWESLNAGYDPATGELTPRKKGAGEDFAMEKVLGERRNLNWSEWVDQFKKYRRVGDYYNKLRNAQQIKHDPLKREYAIGQVYKEYADIAHEQRSEGAVVQELYYIKHYYGKPVTDVALERIRAQYGLSNRDMIRLQGKADKQGYDYTNAWRDARLGYEIEQAVEDHLRGQSSANNDLLRAQYVATLSPAEQATYWTHMEDSLGYTPGMDTAPAILKRYSYYESQFFTVKNQYPFLYRHNTPVNVEATFNWGTIPARLMEDDPGWKPGVVQMRELQLGPDTSMAGFDTTQVTIIAQNFWQEIVRNYPQFAAGVKANFWRRNDPRWKAIGGAATGRGSPKGEVWFNIDDLQNLSARDVRFVLAKELGQANERKFINSPSRAADYHAAIGYKGPETSAQLGQDWSWLGQQAFARATGGSTSPQDFFGHDFADALGYNGGAALFDADRIKELQDKGVLPYAHTDANGYDNPFTRRMAMVKADTKSQLTAGYLAADNLKKEMDAAAQAKNWKAFYALKDKRTMTYDYIDAVRDRMYHAYPDVTKYYEDLHAASVYDLVGNVTKADEMRHQAAIDQAHAPLYQTSAEKRFNYMPAAVKSAYLQDIVDHLEQPGGPKASGDEYAKQAEERKYLKDVYGAKKLYWEWLTPFQQDLMARHYPMMVDKWMHENDEVLHNTTTKEGKFATKDEVAEISAIQNLLRMYDRRQGAKAPPAFHQFVELPKNAHLKAEYLRQHPEVADYIKKGPLANMPTLYRELTLGTMIAYAHTGVGGGGSHRFFSGGRRGGRSSFNPNLFAQSGNFKGQPWHLLPLNLQWAIEQMKVWTRRPQGADGKTVAPPPTYDLWLNMPTGADKAAYLGAHQEVQDWIRSGPMANMPDEYKAVVRDIMVRYGEWTASQDPLGNTLTEFFRLPGYARDEYMRNHPELEVYFAATRTPQEQVMSDLTDSYFKIQDVGAKQAFLAAHPELQEHFVDARTKRYERFLNQVAVYMGANPEMFQGYLTRQQDVLAELLKKFAEPFLIRETPRVNPTISRPVAESGRTRKPAPRSVRA